MRQISEIKAGGHLSAFYEIALGWDSDEQSKLADQVRLIDVAVFSCQSGPVNRCRGPIEFSEHALQALNPSENFRRQANFCSKTALQSAAMNAQRIGQAFRVEQT